MQDHKRNILVGIIVVLLALAISIGWSVWRKHVIAQNPPQATVSESASNGNAAANPSNGTTATGSDQTTTATPTATPLTDEQKNQYTQLAIRFEHAARDWGSDPTAATSDKLAQQPTSALGSIRMPDKLDRSALDAVSSIQLDAKNGPDAPSNWCTAKKTMCEDQPTQISYWHANEWVLGGRITGDPKVTFNPDNTMTVEGTVRVVLWSQDTGAGYRGDDDSNAYWGYTPITGEFPYKDTLTVTDGKISGKVKDVTIDHPWWTDPWFTSWQKNPCDATLTWGNRQQYSIPIKGFPPNLVQQLAPDSSIAFLKNNPSTDGGLWDNVTTAAIPDTSCPDCGY